MDTLSFLHKRKMRELKGQDRNDYLLKNAPLIFAHSREKNQSNKYYIQYLYNINPNLNLRTNKLNEDNYCSDCQIYKRYNIDEGISFCSNCGKTSNLQIEIVMERSLPKPYGRYEHFCKLLDNVLSRGKIDNEVIEIVKGEIERERVNGKELREGDIRRYLKKHKLTKYNGQINLILYRFNKIKPIKISQWMADQIKSMFREVNKIYDYHKRKNYFFSYPFVLYKLCGLLGIRDYNPKLPDTSEK